MCRLLSAKPPPCYHATWWPSNRSLHRWCPTTRQGCGRIKGGPPGPGWCRQWGCQGHGRRSRSSTCRTGRSHKGRWASTVPTMTPTLSTTLTSMTMRHHHRQSPCVGIRCHEHLCPHANSFGPHLPIQRWRDPILLTLKRPHPLMSPSPSCHPGGAWMSSSYCGC